ncbi:antibiotic biosynthesis monooxygenase family protein [Moraxella nasicaprae]|uniref:Antibiotic biosynthesis monooxygenase n=1 Tax=Moraxella nasicaprae TaxID=2904122 RepID=A0ABY6F5K8_9GAMM|nr:antibiotic biosynthesis monooxygenase family protein [Moraxella nasicaprae]UXZ05381.1 antibiotic biosynthesis monooxygenase [Moraxella nasicaprae]
MSNVTFNPKDAYVLINSFIVPAEKEAVMLEFWQKSAEFLKTQDGYIATQLHKNIDPNGHFKFVNVALWESPEKFQKALQTAHKDMPAGVMDGIQYFNGLFEVVYSDMPFEFGKRIG